MQNVCVFCVCIQEHSVCFNDCTFSHMALNRTLNYDLSALSSVGSIMNGPSFTSKGTKYYHQFNISLCGAEVSSHAFISIFRLLIIDCFRNRNSWFFQLLRRHFYSLSLLCRGGRWQCVLITSQICPARTFRTNPLISTILLRLLCANRPSSLQMDGASDQHCHLSPSAWLTLFSVSLCEVWNC